MKILISLLLMLTSAFAVLPDERLQNPQLEARARAISKELRCMICQNQSIDDSDATLAKDLRLLVRERLTAGDSDAQIFSYLRDRYGDIVLLKPPLNAATLLLWGAPFAILILASLFLLRRRGDYESLDDEPPAP